MLNENDLEKIETFQIQAGRGLQRFSPNSPIHSCFYGLGWMDLCTYICVKKLIFALTIIKLDENNMIKKLFKNRAKTFNGNIVMRMLFGIIIYNKKFGALHGE